MTPNEIFQELSDSMRETRRLPMWGFLYSGDEATGAVVTYGPRDNPYMLIAGMTHPELPSRLRFQGGKVYGAFELETQEKLIDHPEFNVYRLLDPVLCLSISYPEELKHQELHGQVMELTAKYFLEEANDKHQLGLPQRFIEWLRQAPSERRITYVVDRESLRLEAMKQPDLFPNHITEITVRFEYSPSSG